MTINGIGSDGERLSALADGEASAAEVAQLCSAWRDDAALRRRWRDYQLIGDVLRSEDLATESAHDSAFLLRLRARLEAEPVVLAPAELPAAVEPPAQPADEPMVAAAGGYAEARRAVARRRRFVWPAAMAAGFVTVVAAGLMLDRQAVTPSGPMLAATPATGSGVLPVVAQQGARPAPAAPGADEEPRTEVASGRLIRDARIDRYLAAHQQWSGGSIGGNVATLRHVAADAPKR